MSNIKVFEKDLPEDLDLSNEKFIGLDNEALGLVLGRDPLTLVQLGLEPIYDVEKNPLGWLDTMLNAVEHMNFFEGRATEYSKASTQGTWVEAFS